MVRWANSSGANGGSSPHTRGDGPGEIVFSSKGEQFSPHAWGWSACRPGAPEDREVLPTRVGMVRPQRTRQFDLACSPHTRGDGPKYSAITAGS